MEEPSSGDGGGSSGDFEWGDMDEDLADIPFDTDGAVVAAGCTGLAAGSIGNDAMVVHKAAAGSNDGGYAAAVGRDKLVGAANLSNGGGDLSGDSVGAPLISVSSGPLAPPR